jgi:hypothetical protein
LGDCLDCALGDDVAPAQVEADQQNLAVLRKRAELQRRAELRRRKLALARHIRNNPDELGKFTIGGAFKSLGKGLTAPIRVVGKVATGDFKGALKAAADPMGLSTLARKAKHTVADVRGAVNAPAKFAAKASAQLGLPKFTAAGFKLPTPPTIKAHCTPCNPDEALSRDITKRVVPEMQRINVLLGKMDLQHKATAEHKRKKADKAWRKEVLVLLKRIQQKRCA